MSFLERLRSHTAPMHQALEKNRYSIALMSNEVTLDDYRTYLEKMYGFVASFEMEVYPLVSDIFPDIEDRKKLHLLAHDIYRLGGDVSSIPVVNSSAMNRMYPNIAAALGGMYVMEGSTLGGVVINKHLQQHLGAAVDDKTSYFSVYGTAAAVKWKALLPMLVSAVETLPNDDEVIRSAAETFSALNKWMS